MKDKDYTIILMDADKEYDKIQLISHQTRERRAVW